MSNSDNVEQVPLNAAKKVGFVSLGCPKALVDSEKILTELKLDGYDVVPSYDDADVVVVNTCGFIDSAKQESLDAINEAIKENGKVVVTGCMGKGSDAELIKSQHPDILSVSGPADHQSVLNAVHEYLPTSTSTTTSSATPTHQSALVPEQGVKLTPSHYAYLKISEGCNHRCSFCIIPHMRGDLVSRPISELISEAKTLKKAGVKELLIISQDTSAYGVDKKFKLDFYEGNALETRIQQLADELGKLGIWVRLHYVYPYPHVDKLIPLMAEGKILPYLDIPFQHASPKILKAMKRPAFAEKVLGRIRQWREICPDLTIRSTFIVGFPGETEEDFEMLLSFLEYAQLDRVGCFKYSPVEGAPANELADQVSEEVKEERFNRFMQKQAVISANRLKSKVGTMQYVIIDEVVAEGAVGRSMADAPEIDGNVFIDGATHLQVGEVVQVRIEETDDYDMWAALA